MESTGYWAVDPMQLEAEHCSRAIETLKNLRSICAKKTELVFIFEPEKANFLGPSTDELNRQMLNLAQTKLKDLCDQFPDVLSPEPHILNQLKGESSTRTLQKWITERNPKFLLMLTHARKGMERLFLGSFTEKMVLEATCPLFVVNPSTMDPKPIHNVMYATDFSDTAQKTFDNLLDQAKISDFKITLFHKLYSLQESMAQSSTYMAGGSWISIPDLLNAEYDNKKKLADQWALKARQSGVAIEMAVDTNPLSTVEAILQRVRQDSIQVVSLTAQSGPVTALLAGSVTRQLIRASHVPVWVWPKQTI